MNLGPSQINNVKIGLILALIIFCALLTACGGQAVPNNANSETASESNSNSNSNSARTSAEDLSLLIKMPFEADEVVWQQDPKTKKIVAVLHFSPEQSKRTIAELEKIKAPGNVALATESWFPPELIAQGDLGSDDTIKGLAYSADPFLQPPYTQGRIIRIDGTDYFVLEISVG